MATNEEMLLTALTTGAEITTEFQPRTNKEAYLAYLNGLSEYLPEPRTREEALLYQLCVNGGIGGGSDDFVITDASYLFYDKARLDVFDTLMARLKNVTTCKYMFYGCNNTALDLSGLDTSSVTDMSYMFTNAHVADLNTAGWDTSKVTDMSYMFQSGLKGVQDLSHFNTESVTTFYRMFRTCSGLKSLNLSGWDTSKAENMDGMFSGCSVLSEIIGFSATHSKGLTISFPTNGSLKRLTFRTDVENNIRSRIDISNNQFDRDGMVEMFNTLCDRSTEIIEDDSNEIVITGNPCVTDGTLTAEDRAIATNKGWVIV